MKRRVLRKSAKKCPLLLFVSKMLISSFLLRFKVNYPEKMRGYPHFYLWIPTALAKIYFFHVVLTWGKTFVFSRHRP